MEASTPSWVRRRERKLMNLYEDPQIGRQADRRTDGYVCIMTENDTRQAHHRQIQKWMDEKEGNVTEKWKNCLLWTHSFHLDPTEPIQQGVKGAPPSQSERYGDRWNFLSPASQLRLPGRLASSAVSFLKPCIVHTDFNTEPATWTRTPYDWHLADNAVSFITRTMILKCHAMTCDAKTNTADLTMLATSYINHNLILVKLIFYSLTGSGTSNTSLWTCCNMLPVFAYSME